MRWKYIQKSQKINYYFSRDHHHISVLMLLPTTTAQPTLQHPTPLSTPSGSAENMVHCFRKFVTLDPI